MANRRNDRKKGRPVFYPVRYADDFILICTGSKEQATEEKQALAKMLKLELGLELSQEKTRITSLEEGFHFLGHHIRLRKNERWGYVLQALTPLDRQGRLRDRIKSLLKRTNTNKSLAQLIMELNPIIRGWGYFYRHTNGAYGVFKKMDYYIFMRIFHWLRGKHKTRKWNKLYKRFRKPGFKGGMRRWTDGTIQMVQLLDIPRGRWKLNHRIIPEYMLVSGEPGA